MTMKMFVRPVLTLVLVVLNAPLGDTVRVRRKFQKPSGDIPEPEPLVESSAVALNGLDELRLLKYYNKKKKRGGVKFIYMDYLLNDGDENETIVEVGPITIQAVCVNRTVTASGGFGAKVTYVIEPQDDEYYLTGTTLSDPDFAAGAGIADGIKTVAAGTIETGDLIEQSAGSKLDGARNANKFGTVRTTLGWAFGILGETSYVIAGARSGGKLGQQLGVNCLIQGIIWYSETSDI